MPSRIAYASRRILAMAVARSSAARGEQGDHLTDVTPGGRGADAEPGGQPREWIPVAQVRQRQQGLLAGLRRRQCERCW